MILWVHIAAGLVALVAGAAAASLRKGGRWHARAGTGFVVAMLVLGVTASILEPYRNPPGSPVSGVLVLYFIGTAWVAARRRDGGSGWPEIVACVAALGLGAAMLWGGYSGMAQTPVGSGPVLALAGLCLFAGLLDLSVILRRTLSARARISRHLWRMCFAFFIATGSFFLGQQKVLPAAMHGSSALFVIAFAPFGLMLFWLVRVRIGKRFRGEIAHG